jgi:NAD+ kinase
MPRAFNNIAIISRPSMLHIKEVLYAVIDFLQKQKKYTLILESKTAELLGERLSVSIQTAEKLGRLADVVVVIGGDGSLLYGANIAVNQQLPVIGINRGYLGFLSDIHPNDMLGLKMVLDGHYTVEHRSLLCTTVYHHDHLIYQGKSLNETVMFVGDSAHMLTYEIEVSGKIICQQRADGLLVATPTGSTAYALSAGGPIIHPALNCMLLIPMFPHTLSSRPLVINDDNKIQIRVIGHPASAVAINCDGRKRVDFPFDAVLNIEKCSESLALIHPEKYDYFATLREKLAWHR